MACRAHLATATAMILASKGNGEAGMELLSHLDEEMRHEYNDLHNRMRALASNQPETPFPKRIRGLSLIGMSPAEQLRARELAVQLTSMMEETVGRRLPERDEEMAVTVSAAEIPSVAAAPPEEQ